MAYARVEQRNARLASGVRIDYVQGRDGEVAKGTVSVISNTRRGSGEDRTDEATSIQWTLWGPQAENAAAYLGKGSRVNVVGRLQNNNYEKDGATVYGFGFTVEELDYLDSKAASEARKERQEWANSYDQGQDEQPAAAKKARVRVGRSGQGRSNAAAN